MDGKRTIRPMRTARRAHAKLNLALAVGPPIPGPGPTAGMHPIASWMHAIDLHDTIEIEALPADRPSRLDVRWAPDAPRRTPIDWPPERDLALRALLALEASAARPIRAHLALTKRIPTGAGLGGGSSDAAATLLAANQLFSLDLPLPRLADIARPLGSDIAYFLDDTNPPRPALVRGLGDQITRLQPQPDLWAVLLLPSFGCPTGPVYKSFDSLPPRPFRDSEIASLADARPIPTDRLFNDLDQPAAAVAPALTELRTRAAAAAGAPVHMSGSGSTLYLISRSGPSARELQTKLSLDLPDVTTMTARLV